MNKPTTPSVTLPSSFGGDKSNFSADKIANGYEPDVPDILGGANLNYLLDTLGRKETYYDTIVDFIKYIPINKTIGVNANNQLVYINSNIDDKVNKSGDTMTGNLTIAKDSPLFTVKEGRLSSSTTISSTVYTNMLRLQNNDNATLCELAHAQNADGSHYAYIQVRKSPSESTTYSTLRVGFNSSGNAYTTAVTPSASSNGTDIATTAWVRTRIANSVSYNSSTRTLTIG